MVDQSGNLGITVVRFSGKYPPEFHFRIGEKEREIELSVIMEEEGLIVGKKLREEGDHEETQKDP